MTRDFVYLASASPRRSDLLRQIGVPFVVEPAEIPEVRREAEPPAAFVGRIAAEKAAAVASSARVRAAPQPVLGADTAVVVDATVFGKPVDAVQALAMLEALSGRSHTVLTAVALVWEGHCETSLSASEVRFRATTAAERQAYCATGEPLDKAGAYGIQGLGAVFVEELRGSYSAVMGLPLYETAALLARFGLPRWLTPARVRL